jgi:ATP phosphoribosyltransferase
MQPITLALSKGRILTQSLELLATANIVPIQDIHTSRKLIFKTNHPQINLAVIRATDVPTYVAYGAADIGITGKDTLLEHPQEHNWYEVLDLKIAQCKLMSAKLIEEPPITGRLKVAAKFANIASRFYAARNEPVNIIKLYGSLELAPVMGLAHRIVDIVDTGKTLAANHMQADELICNISARLIVNPASMKVHHNIINEMLAELSSIIAQETT